MKLDARYKDLFSKFAEVGCDAGLVFRLDGTARLRLIAGARSVEAEFADHAQATFEACAAALGHMAGQLLGAPCLQSSSLLA